MYEKSGACTYQEDALGVTRDSILLYKLNKDGGDQFGHRRFILSAAQIALFQKCAQFVTVGIILFDRYIPMQIFVVLAS